jgi:bacillithiol synthase
MRVDKVSFEQTHSFSQFFIDFATQKESLQPFYHRFPTIENFKAQTGEKAAAYSLHNRETLVASLRKQYEGFTLSNAVSNNLNALAEQNTFTVTTGHQLNIFTGPLYFIYKIVTVINACKQLKAKYPESNFVPVYWMASEDHDYDEIKYFRLYDKKYVWETQQQGAVGRFHTKDFASLLKEIPGDIEIFKEAYTNNHKLADAARQYVNELFADEGLIIVDGDDRELKGLFKKVIKEDVFKHTTKKLVDKTNTDLEALGYKPQIYCREINFFYLDDHLRSRIEKKGDLFEAVDTDLKFTRTQIEELIDRSPEKFSPNVILRPLYQEVILPNIAYCGGPAEIIYWLQLKDVFNNFKTSFPVLLPRCFGLAIDEPTARKMEKTELAIEDFFLEKNYLFNHYVLKHSGTKLTVNGEREAIKHQFEKVKAQVEKVDKSLAPMVAAETRRLLKSLEKIEYKLLRAEKRVQTDKLRQIEAIKDTLFPNGSLQERSDNFLNFYQQDNAFLQKLLDSLDPFDLRFNVMYL